MAATDAASPSARSRRDLLDVVRHNVAQIIISHRLQDIFEVGDRVMVLKRGRRVGERHVKDTDEHEVLALIVQGDAMLEDPA